MVAEVERLFRFPEVARLYRFRAIHHLPEAPEPWCFPHEHTYTVEVVAAGPADDRGMVVDTDQLDTRWRELQSALLSGGGDLNAVLAVQPTTVENLAACVLKSMRDVGHGGSERVVRVTVWEDDQRWGRAIA